MKGIETVQGDAEALEKRLGSDHCPAMKGIETSNRARARARHTAEATTAPQ